MDMNVNSKVVKALRKQKLWSQDELAAACGVSLRTIQRIEGDGNASPETLKALASVFEINVMILTQEYDKASTYQNVQLGYPILLALTAVVVMTTRSFSNGEMSVNVFLACVIFEATLCVLFCTLTTRVHEDKLVWYFGVGLIRKSLVYSNIRSVKQVRNKAWWGWGIRLIPNGWLYCVSGLDAIELNLDSGKTVRIGTDEPEALVQAIEQARIR